MHLTVFERLQRRDIKIEHYVCCALKITTNRPAGIENIPKLYLFDNLIEADSVRDGHT